MRCENYYSSAEAAARAVDAICMVLLGDNAAVNFPKSSYNTADLEDAAGFLRCISGGAFQGRSCKSEGQGAAKSEGAALQLLLGMHQPDAVKASPA